MTTTTEAVKSGSWSDARVLAAMPHTYQLDGTPYSKAMTATDIEAAISDYTTRLAEVQAGLAAGLRPQLAANHLSMVIDEADVLGRLAEAQPQPAKSLLAEMLAQADAAYSAASAAVAKKLSSFYQAARQKQRLAHQAEHKAAQQAKRLKSLAAKPQSAKLPKMSQLDAQHWQATLDCGCRYDVKPADLTERQRADGWLLTCHNQTGDLTEQNHYTRRKDALDRYRFLAEQGVVKHACA